MLFGLAIEKSNFEADVMKIELPGSESDLCPDTNQKQGRRFVDGNRKQGRHVQRISTAFHTILGGVRCSENYY